MFHGVLVSLLFFVWCTGSVCSGRSTTDLDTILTNGVNSHLYPGAVAMVGDENGVLYSYATGRYEYNVSSPFVDVRSLCRIYSM